MDKFIVVVDKLKDWQPYYPTEQLVTVQDYLFEKKYQEANDLRIINLSRNYKYLSLGYYCSLLAEARSHKIIPSLKTINDLSKKRLYFSDLDELQKITTQMLSKFEKRKDNVTLISFRIYFSQTQIAEFKKLALEIYGYYPAPILEVRLVFDKVWKIDAIVPLSIQFLTEDEETFFASAIEKFSTRIWRLPREQRTYIYDLAVLVNPEDTLPPSDEEALQKFRAACDRQSVYCEMITKKDISRINEFDALFIRETTSISNHTYRFAKTAASEGLVVVDDPDSILKCTNKIFISNLMDRIGLKNIPGKFVSNHSNETLNELEKEIGFPMVVKIPDGSFSLGVKKVENKTELNSMLEEMLKKSDLILAQKFVYTKFDWRIGVFGGEGLFACKYYMSENHWQIYNHTKEQASSDFAGGSETLAIEDVPKNIMDAAIKATRSIGLSLYGVDMKEDEAGNLYIVEINDNPNIDAGAEDLVIGDKLYDRIVSRFVSEIQKKKNVNM